MKTSKKKSKFQNISLRDLIWYGLIAFIAVGVLVLLPIQIVRWGREAQDEGQRIRAAMAAGQTYEEKAVLEGVVDGVKVEEASSADPAINGAGAAALTKLAGGSNKEAAVNGAISGGLTVIAELLTSGCYVHVSVDGRHERFHADKEWPCLKYKTGDKIAVERTVRYRELAFPGQHQKGTEASSPKYVPKFE